jgi:hypothetical protein
VATKLTTMSAVLLPLSGPEWTGAVAIERLPGTTPYAVRVRETPEAASAPATVRLLASATAYGSDGKVIVCAGPRFGQSEETPPPPLAQRSTVSVAL